MRERRPQVSPRSIARLVFDIRTARPRVRALVAPPWTGRAPSAGSGGGGPAGGPRLQEADQLVGAGAARLADEDPAGRRAERERLLGRDAEQQPEAVAGVEAVAGAGALLRLGAERAGGRVHRA